MPNLGYLIKWIKGQNAKNTLYQLYKLERV